MSVGIWVDGESLIDIIHRLEAPCWAANGMAQPEGQYVWVPAQIILPPSRHMFGEPADGWCGEYSVLVVCRCGEYACRAFAARIEATGKTVQWSPWAEFPPEEAWFNGQFPPMVFDRTQ